MYRGSFSPIKCKNLMKQPIMISQGVHQSNVLSTLLSNIFINDIGDEMCVNDVSILHDTRVSHLLYADLVLFSISETGLQSNIDQVCEFFKKWC